jgi:hypothetical protein
MLLVALVLMAGCTKEPRVLPPGIPDTPPQLEEKNITLTGNTNIPDFFVLTYTQPIFLLPEDYAGQVDFSKIEDLSETEFFKEYTKRTGNFVDIYPGDFLIEYKKTSDMTRLFYVEPTEENARLLVEQQKKTLLRYIQDLSRFIKSIDQNENYMFLMRNGQTVSKTELKEMLTDINQNAAYILAQIEIRESVLNNEAGYSLPMVKMPELTEFEVLNQSDVISKPLAKTLMSLYIFYSDDMNKTYDESLTWNAEEFKLYKINLKCWEQESGFVYGIDKDVYPNILLAERDMITFDYTHWQSWDNGFTSCSCPYSDVERLNWFLVDDMYKKISSQKIESVKEYEDMFLANPSQKNLELLGVVYRSQLYQDLREQKKDDLAKLWLRMHQIEMKSHLFNKVMDDINWSTHFGPFIVKEEGMEKHYQQIIATDSFFTMTFMPWSSSVWFKPEPMVFDDNRTKEQHLAMLPKNDFLIEDVDAFIRAEAGTAKR